MDLQNNFIQSDKNLQEVLEKWDKFCISCYHHFFSTIIKRSREKAGKNGGYLWVL